MGPVQAQRCRHAPHLTWRSRLRDAWGWFDPLRPAITPNPVSAKPGASRGACNRRSLEIRNLSKRGDFAHSNRRRVSGQEATALALSVALGKPKFLRSVGLWILPVALRGKAS